MLLPAITDYIGALENPTGVFRTLGEVSVERDIYGAVHLRAGNSAAVFRYTDEAGKARFLKCHIRPNPHLRAVYDYIERRRPALLPEVRLLPGELWVHTLGGGSGWADVVEGEWISGETLAAAVARAVKARDGVRLGELAAAFDALRASLAAAEWAHGDLKPENIIVRSGGVRVDDEDGCSGYESVTGGQPLLALIDCDAMWIPALAGKRAAELGTPPYRDPARVAAQGVASGAMQGLSPEAAQVAEGVAEQGAARFDKTIDDYPARLIGEALHRLASRPELWSGYTSFEESVFAIEAPLLPCY